MLQTPNSSQIIESKLRAPSNTKMYFLKETNHMEFPRAIPINFLIAKGRNKR